MNKKIQEDQAITLEKDEKTQNLSKTNELQENKNTDMYHQIEYLRREIEHRREMIEDMQKEAIDHGVLDSLLLCNWSTIIYDHIKACDIKREMNQKTNMHNDIMLNNTYFVHALGSMMEEKRVSKKMCNETNRLRKEERRVSKTLNNETGKSGETLKGNDSDVTHNNMIFDTIHKTMMCVEFTQENLKINRMLALDKTDMMMKWKKEIEVMMKEVLEVQERNIIDRIHDRHETYVKENNVEMNLAKFHLIFLKVYERIK